MALRHPNYRTRVLLLAGGGCGLGLLLEYWQPGSFARIVGPVPVTPVFVACVLLTYALAPALPRIEHPSGDIRGTLRWLWWVVPFAASVTAIDLLAPFSATINVGLPEALLFYPSMAVVAEVVFHLVPLSLWKVAGRRRTNDGGFAGARAAIVLIAALEPIFQAVLGRDPARPWWGELLTGLHIYGLNLVLVTLFLRRGLPAALMLRLAYYVYWHLLYGQLRLLWLG